MEELPVQMEEQLPIVYVGNLPLNLSEKKFYEKFQSVGKVLSVLLCRNSITWESLGYGYVVFKDVTKCRMAYYALDKETIDENDITVKFVERETFKAGSDNVFCSYSKLGRKKFPTPNCIEIQKFDGKKPSEPFRIFTRKRSVIIKKSLEIQGTENAIFEDMIGTFLYSRVKELYPEDYQRIVALILKKAYLRDRLKLLEDVSFIKVKADEYAPEAKYEKFLQAKEKEEKEKEEKEKKEKEEKEMKEKEKEKEKGGDN
ncbi:UNVERIFIED_CONTAM: hypothetical protein RMT77_015895 [Armadillidium vulgare]